MKFGIIGKNYYFCKDEATTPLKSRTMDDEIKNEQTTNGNSDEMRDDEARNGYENAEEESEKVEHTDYRPVNRFDASVVHHLSGMYQNWFLDYASYVILERAVPHIEDGLKPVQRRILHSMKRMDDGRYNKVANIVGHTMQFHR